MPETTIPGNILHTPATVAALIRNVKKQQAFIREHIQPDLAEADQKNDGSLEISDFKKITGYYGLSVPAILGESLAILRNLPLSERERFALTYMGATTGLFDDFFDKYKLQEEKIMMLLDHPEKLKGENAAQDLFIHFYKKALGKIHNTGKVLEFCRKVYDAQIESKKQAEPGLTREQIFQTTIHKGGVSVLFYRAAMAHPFLPGEEEALYEIGGLMQFGNDVFDIFKDRNNHIYTLMTTAEKIDDVRKMFRQQIEKSFEAFGKLNYKPNDIKKFLRMISLCLCSRCFVFFDQLENKQQSTGNMFRPELYSRQDLVCDMEKTSNKWKTLLYHVKHRIKIPVAGKL